MAEVYERHHDSGHLRNANAEAAAGRWTREAWDAVSTLRAAIIGLAFLLYEVPLLPRVFQGEQWVRFPVVDVEMANHELVFVALEVLYGAAVLLISFRWLVAIACLMGGASSIALVLLDSSDRLQFAYLPGGALLAMGLSQTLRGKANKREELPLALFLGSIYAFASLHKLLNFSSMQQALPEALLTAPGGAMASLGTTKEHMVFQLITWTVVPYEAALAALTLTRRWFRARILAASLFHGILVILAPHIWTVSLFMVALHVYLLAVQAPGVITQMLRGRNWSALLGAEVLLVAMRITISHQEVSLAQVSANASLAALVLLPPLFLLWPLAKCHVVCHGGEKAIDKRSAAFAGLLALFGIWPLLLAQKYSIRNAGWSMFAGGQQAVGTYYRLVVPSVPCLTYPPVPGVLWTEMRGRETVYSSYRKGDLERLIVYFRNTRNCESPPLIIEVAEL